MLRGSRILSHAARGSNARGTFRNAISPLPCPCSLRRSTPRDPVLTWIRTFFFTGPHTATPNSNPGAAATHTAKNTAKSTDATSNISQPHTRARRKTVRQDRRAQSPLLSKANTQPTTKETRRLLKHLTELQPGEFNRVTSGAYGPKRLELFRGLHAALQNAQDPETMWRAYQDLRKDREGLELLSSDILRLLVVHFKDAPSSSQSPFQKNSYSWDQQAREQTWAARIVTVIDDKRSTKGILTRWDLSDLMSALNRSERYEETLQELERSVQSNIKLDPILLNHAVRAWGGLERLDKAIEAIQDAKATYNVRASAFTLGYMTQQCLLMGRRTVANAFWQELLQAGALDDPATVNGILRACVRVQDSDFAQTVYDAMPQLGTEPNIDSLNLMLSLAVAEIQSPEERAALLRTIHERSTRSDKPVFDKRILDSILVDFAKKGDAEGAILIHQLMQQQGFLLGTKEYNTILHCYVRQQEMDRAINWFQHMRQVGVRPDQVSFKLLMRSYTLQRMPRETEALFRQMLQDHIEPDLMVCNSLLLAYEQARMNRRCLQLYRTMFQDRAIGLDQFSFSCMFNAVFHQDKALLEGGEGLQGSGSSMEDTGFQLKIAEPIGRPTPYSEQRAITLENKDRQVGEITTDGSSFAGTTPTQLCPPLDRKRYQFENAVSHTTSLDPRSLFRDMIIVGIRPTQSLYSNILRAFLSRDDFAGAAVALRALLDYYVLKPTPKMSAIVVSWVCQAMEEDQKQDSVVKAELAKLIHMMGRTRGLIDMLERVTKTQSLDKNRPSDEVLLSLTAPKETAGAHTLIDSQLKTGVMDKQEDAIARAKREMGGDLTELYTRSAMAGSTWSMAEDRPTQIDLKDFERWYRAYSNRTTYAQTVRNEQFKAAGSSSSSRS
ncbi:hypothetical protein KVV02_001782 [Mortierella alpina]|uniref:Uncharacterized protein n=1 Tax=Mortierella alpina TaxID=64518 RepID=A0A9P7ZYK5_MORAP|nr:hypothetical protein KVV02_001782 [Mortierella alpina]